MSLDDFSLIHPAMKIHLFLHVNFNALYTELGKLPFEENALQYKIPVFKQYS